MNRLIAVMGVVTAVLLLLGISTSAQAKSRALEQDGYGNLNHQLHERILLAHHVGNRPDDAPDIEDTVHGGDYDPDWDPNGEETPPEPGRPDNDPEDNDSPEQGGSGNDRDTEKG